MPEPATRLFLSRRLRLAVHEWGERDAPPLILVHGGRDHARSWDRVAEVLARDWRVLAPDLAGHGDSAWIATGDYGMAGFVYDLAQLVESEALERVTIVAHSLGGNIALRYAGSHPEKVRRLVAIEGLGASPAWRAEREAVPVGRRLRDWIDKARALAAAPPRKLASLEEAEARMRRTNPRIDDALVRHLTRHALRRNEDGGWSWKHDPAGGALPSGDLPVSDQEQLWAAIPCPVLLVYGSESWASDPLADGRIAPFRHANRVMIEGAGHWVQHDRFDEFMAATVPFLDRANA